MAHTAEFEIIVNGRPRKWTSPTITYSQVVDIAYTGSTPPSGEGVVITVTYSKGGPHHQGSLLPGGSVEVTNGMVFDVTATTRS